MLKVLDIQSHISCLKDDDGNEYEVIVVTAIYDPDLPYCYLRFGKESDIDRGIEYVGSSIYAYLPDSFFETHKRRTLSSRDIKVLWNYIEKYYD